STGTLRARVGRRADLGALLVVAAVYFGATMVLSVVAHDGFGLAAGQFGFIIAAPGLLWALAGLWTGSHPALDSIPFRGRAVPAGVAMTLGVLVLGGTTVLAESATSTFVGLLVGAGLAGVAMGSMYPDLLGRCLRAPAVDDGISQDQMAAALVLTESVGMAVATTAAYSWLGTGWGVVDGPLQRSQILYLALAALCLVMVQRLWAAARRRARLPRAARRGCAGARPPPPVPSRLRHPAAAPPPAPRSPRPLPRRSPVSPQRATPGAAPSPCLALNTTATN